MLHQIWDQERVCIKILPLEFFLYILLEQFSLQNFISLLFLSLIFLGLQVHVYNIVNFYSSDFCGSIHFSPIFLSPFFGLGNFYFSNFNFTDSDDSCPMLRSFYTFLFKLLYFSALKNSFLKLFKFLY